MVQVERAEEASCPEPCFSELVEAILLALHLDAPGLALHSKRVAFLSATLSEEFLPERTSEIYIASLLHDVGIVGASPGLASARALQFEGKPLGDEVINHASRSAYLISSLFEMLPDLAPSVTLVLDHHEWWDGTGYPGRKRGAAIDPGAHLIRAADALTITAFLQQTTDPTELEAALASAPGTELSLEVWEGLRRRLAEEKTMATFAQPELLEAETKRRLRLHTWEEETVPIQLLAHPTLQIFVELLESKHSHTAGHSRRVASSCSRIASRLGLSEAEAEDAYRVGLLHDVGKIGTPRDILSYPGRLTDPEQLHAVRRHPEHAQRLLSGVCTLAHLAAPCYHAFERWDGSGYPEGLKGVQIPLLSRIASVCDTFDTMLSHRPYAENRTGTEALDELKRCAGKQFDPEVVEVATHFFSKDLLLDLTLD